MVMEICRMGAWARVVSRRGGVSGGLGGTEEGVKKIQWSSSNRADQIL